MAKSNVYLLQDDYMVTKNKSNGGEYLFYVWYNDRLVTTFTVLNDAIQYVLDN